MMKPTVQTIRLANPEFFSIAQKMGDVNYQVREDRGRWWFLFDTRFTKPTYKIDPTTHELSYSHDRGDDDGKN